jgi:hypothetical protein
MPSIIMTNQAVFVDVAEQLKARLEENVFTSLLTRLLDVWEKGKLEPDHTGRVAKLCFQYGRIEQKTVVLKLMNEVLENQSSSRVNLPSETVIDFIMAMKAIRKTDSLLSFYTEAYLFLSNVLTNEPHLARKLIDIDTAALLLTKMGDLLATGDYSHPVFANYLNFSSQVICFEEIK